VHMLAFCQVNVLNEYDDDDDEIDIFIHSFIHPN